MGLFSRKPKDEAAGSGSTPTKKSGKVDVQAELAAMQERLIASERAKTDLEARLRELDDVNSDLTTRIATLDEANAQLDSRLGALDAGVTRMGDQLTALSASSDRLDQRLVAIDDLDAQVRDLTERLNTPAPPPPPDAAVPPPPGATAPPPPPLASSPPPPPSSASPTPPPPPPIADAPRDEMAAQLADLSAAVALHAEQMSATQQRLAEIEELTSLLDSTDADTAESEIATLRERLDAINDQMAAMDGRVTSVSTELANQLTELSRDIDELNRRASEAADSNDAEHAGDADTAELETRLAERLDAAIDDVMGTTERLAAEQARYEIQFRADLAELAERLRRPGTS